MTGLRLSELFSLRWGDLDFDNAEINVVRSVVHGVVSRCKTESSTKPNTEFPGNLAAQSVREAPEFNAKVVQRKGPEGETNRSKKDKNLW